MLPFLAVVDASFNVYLSYAWYPNDNLFTLQYGTITIRTIQRLAQDRLYGFVPH